MNYIKGESRTQMQLFSWDDFIEKDSEVRMIDTIIEHINIENLGFNMGKSNLAVGGRPNYDPKSLLKLIIYGYLNGIRSSRKLEKQAKINIEVKWLINNINPKHSAIADFRKNNISCFEELFIKLNKLCQSLDLVGKELIAVDGTKIRANASKRKHYSEKKLIIMEKLAEEKLSEYIKSLEINDCLENQLELKEKVASLKSKKKEYAEIRKHLEYEKQFNTTDIDAKRMRTGNTYGRIIGYNVQTAIDAKNKLIVNYDVVNTPVDQPLLYHMARKAKEALDIDKFEVLADKGYYSQQKIIACENENITVYISRPIVKQSEKQDFYPKNAFKYDKENDLYICPEGKKLDQRYYKKSINKTSYFNYDACSHCKTREKCTKSKKGRHIEGDTWGGILQQVDKRTLENPKKYQLRSQLVEHPFGTLKRTMNFNHFLLRGLRKVNGEMSIAFFAYNLKRLMKIKEFSYFL